MAQLVIDLAAVLAAGFVLGAMAGLYLMPGGPK